MYNRTSAVRSIVSPKTIKQLQVLTHSQQREAFLLQWCMASAFSWYSIRKLHQGPGRGETEETCLYCPPHHSRKWQTSLSVGAKQQPAAVLEESLCVIYVKISYEELSSCLTHLTMRVSWGQLGTVHEQTGLSMQLSYLSSSVHSGGWQIWVTEN